MILNAFVDKFGNIENMAIAEQIEKILTESLNPVHLEVINQSHLHAGHAGDDGSGESHFTVVVVADKLNGLSRVARHRMIFGLLQDAIETMPHALSIRALTPDEYK